VDNNLLAEFRARLRAMEDSLKDAPIAHTVEVGAALATMVKAAETLQEAIKVTIRDAALNDLGNQPGTITLHGTEGGSVSVTVPVSKLRMSKSADAELLQKVLGDQFDLYFETQTTHKPRDMAGDLIAGMPDGSAKTVLLSAIEQFDATPRVSFKVKP